MHCVSYDPGKPNSAWKLLAVCHILGKPKDLGNQKERSGYKMVTFSAFMPSGVLLDF